MAKKISKKTTGVTGIALPPDKSKTEPKDAYSFRFDSELMGQFKKACSARGYKVTEMLEYLMKQVVDQSK